MRTVDALRALETATAAQRGLITSAQAARLDIDRTTLSRLTAAGDLTAVRRGVHALPSAATDPHLEACPTTRPPASTASETSSPTGTR